MRPVATAQSALQYPLNYILGTEAALRVLRVIYQSDIPIGIAELARQAQLQKSGVARICTRLEDLGVLEAIGRGDRNRQFRRSTRFAFGQHIATLFHEERQRYVRIISEVAAAFSGLPYIKSAWIEGALARGTDRPGDPLSVGGIADTNQATAARSQVWSSMLRVQELYDLSISLRIMTLPDLKTASETELRQLQDVILLLGPSPLDLIGEDPRRHVRNAIMHGQLDARSAKAAAFIADKLAKDPLLVEAAKRYLDQRIPGAAAGERLELEEWRGLLRTMSVARLRRFLVSDDERAVRLRQSSPFLPVLSDSDRSKLRKRLAR